MTHKIITAIFTLIAVMFGAAPGRTQTTEPTQAASAPAPSQKIVTKDPDYLKLLNPPEGNYFLKLYSETYREKSAEIEAKVATLSDDNLRVQTANEEWIAAHKSDGDKFMYEAATAFREAKISFAQKHRDGWFVVGRVNYEELNNVLAAVPNPTTPIVAVLRVPMKAETLNQIYAKFHDVAGQEIEKKAQEHVASAGAGSNCARNADWCYKYAKEDIEQKLRSERMMFVVQGDMESMKVDRMLLVDYDTETIFLELDGRGPGLSNTAWRFSVGPVPSEPVSPASAEKQSQPSKGDSAAPLPSPIQNESDAKSGNAGESKSESPAASNASPERISVPQNVVAASILTQTKPDYPPQARASHIQGEVALHAIIDKNGNIAEVRALSGDEVLAKSAMDAVRQWKYKPMLVDGEPKEVDTIITVTFSLAE